MLIKEPEIALAVAEALNKHRGSLSRWEIRFLVRLLTGYQDNSRLSIIQKMKVIPILERLGCLKTHA